MPTPTVIYEFQGKYRFLSNFWIEPDGTCVEREYQAAKTDDPGQKLEIFNRVVCSACRKRVRGLQILFNHCENCDSAAVTRRDTTPGEAKVLGRSVTLRSDWESVKLKVMKDLVLAKFSQSEEMTGMLLDTIPAVLIEGNRWGDRFWGKVDGGHGTGENWLGKLLMEVRDELLPF